MQHPNQRLNQTYELLLLYVFIIVLLQLKDTFRCFWWSQTNFWWYIAWYYTKIKNVQAIINKQKEKRIILDLKKIYRFSQNLNEFDWKVQSALPQNKTQFYPSIHESNISILCHNPIQWPAAKCYLKLRCSPCSFELVRGWKRDWVSRISPPF